jgi:hypothetical protein
VKHGLIKRDAVLEVMVVLAQQLAMIRGEDYECVLLQALLAEAVQDAADIPIYVGSARGIMSAVSNRVTLLPKDLERRYPTGVIVLGQDRQDLGLALSPREVSDQLEEGAVGHSIGAVGLEQVDPAEEGLPPLAFQPLQGIRRRVGSDAVRQP